MMEWAIEAVPMNPVSEGATAGPVRTARRSWSEGRSRRYRAAGPRPSRDAALVDGEIDRACRRRDEDWVPNGP